MTQDDIQTAFTNIMYQPAKIYQRASSAHLVIVLYVGLGNEDPLDAHGVVYLMTVNYGCVNPLYRSAVNC